MKKLILILCSALFIQSCTVGSYRSVTGGTFTGGMLGGAIGGLMGGPRGRDLGTVIGVIAGAASSAAIANAAERRAEERYNDYVSNYDNSSRRSYRDARRVTNGTNYSSSQYSNSGSNNSGYIGNSNTTVATSPLVLRNLRFIDDGGNQTINREEDGKIIFELANPTSETIYDVVPYLYEISGNSHITLSPSTRIEAIKAGDVIRYTCSIRADKKLAAGKLDFRIAVSTAEQDFVTLREFSLPTAK